LQAAAFALTGVNKISYQLPSSSIADSQNELRIGINIWLAPIFNHVILPFMQTHFPHISFKFITRPTNVLKKLLEYDSIHFSIHFENLAKTPFMCEHLLQDEVVFLCHKNDVPLLDGKLIAFEHAALTNNLEKVSSVLSKLQEVSYQMVDDVQNMLAFVESGYGFTTLPRSILYHMNFPRMANIAIAPIKDINLTASICFEYREGGHFQEAIDQLKQELQHYVKVMYKEEELSI
jgi:DNA-binding transcriptional LysR family regulator